MATAKRGVLDAGIGQVLQPIDIGAQPAQGIALDLVQRGVLQVSQAEAHAGQRCAHFMCHRLRQRAGFQQLLQLFGHVIEGINNGRTSAVLARGARVSSWPSRMRRAACASCETSRHKR